MIKLTLTDEQAKIVSVACEFYARMRMGQFQEILFNCMQSEPKDNFCDRREHAEMHLFAARKSIMPELKGRGHSYGIGKFKDADQAFDVHQVIRHQFGDGRTPFSYYDLPKCERKGD